MQQEACCHTSSSAECSACRLESFGVSATSVRVVGGGSKNTLWRQIIADVLRRPVIIPEVAESAALGAALQAAAVASGADVAEFVREHAPSSEEDTVTPIAANAVWYQEAFDRHQKAGEALFAPPV